KKQTSELDTSDNVTIIIGNDFFRFDGNDSLVLIRMGSRGLNIQDSPDGKKVDIEKYDTEVRDLEDADKDKDKDRNWNQDREEQDRYRGGRNFRGHWAGLEAGFNNYLHVASMTLPEEIAYMSLDASKSNCFNLNFSQVNIGFSRHFGIVTGLGVTFNNYRFENQNSIVEGQDGTISGLIPIDVSVKKSKFSTLYLNVPIMLEAQIPAGYSHRLNVAAGVIGGLKLNAWTKIVLENGEKNRVNGDYNLNLLRGGVTARIGYGNFMIYGSYYLTPWFQDLKGPNGYNLEPFEIGLAFTFND
ncbi:MAG: outer membrane beta-barrel protein, partial [Bacteroidia bacterium]|nr:outer membrane beta-barrel protein [Bacteroidia bacterium]